MMASSNQLKTSREKSGHQLRKKIPPCRLPLDLNCSINSSWSLCPCWSASDFGLAILHNDRSQFLKVNLSPPSCTYNNHYLVSLENSDKVSFLPSCFFFLPSVYHVSIAVIQSLGRCHLSYTVWTFEKFEGSASSTSGS